MRICNPSDAWELRRRTDNFPVAVFQTSPGPDLGERNQAAAEPGEPAAAPAGVGARTGTARGTRRRAR